MLSDSIKSFSISSESDNTEKYAKILSIPKYNSDKVFIYDNCHLIKIIEANTYWYYETTLCIESGQTWVSNPRPYCRAYYTSLQQNNILVVEEDNLYTVYVKANVTGTKIYSQILFSTFLGGLTNYTGEKFVFNVNELTSQIKIEDNSNISEIKKILNNNYKLIDNLTGRSDSLEFVNSINPVNYKYDCPVNTWPYDNTTLENYASSGKLPSNLQCIWNVNCVPMIGTKMDTIILQTWETIANGVYSKYIRNLNANDDEWKQFRKII